VAKALDLARPSIDITFGKWVILMAAHVHNGPKTRFTTDKSDGPFVGFDTADFPELKIACRTQSDPHRSAPIPDTLEAVGDAGLEMGPHTWGPNALPEVLEEPEQDQPLGHGTRNTP